MRTPVVVLAGQGDTDAVAGVLLQRPGTLVVRHRFDGHVVARSLTMLRNALPTTSHYALELSHGCVACTIRNDLLTLLRRVHRRQDVDRVVVHLPEWLEPEPVCWAIHHVRVSLGPGYIDGPAARDVCIAGVVAVLDSPVWLEQALGDDELDDGRTLAQVVVGQAEFADVLVAPRADHPSVAVLKRLAPRARIVQGADHVEHALANLGGDARLGRTDDPLGPLLDGSPPLEQDGPVGIVEFAAQRPFHPGRLHEAIDVLLSGVVRARGRIWLAGQSKVVMYLESAGGGLRVSPGGKWLAAMSERDIAAVDDERRALASLVWDDRHGDRRTSLVAVVCGARAEEITGTLQAALLTDVEMADPDAWRGYDDPFGDWHEDPCGASSPTEVAAPQSHRSEDNE